ncbi:BspA family leucine-rich repeat surface protein [Blautia sp. RTP21359st1_E11_RTP21359_211015]|uniref:BspA family leucine-rich repeat surface protein n=1 Tax=Blautia sp. RTP21359st1_E11_RTP21359_211015 TaxID=3141591 RepID=UPI0034A40FB6
MFEKMAAGMALAAAMMAGVMVMPGSGHGLVARVYAADTSNQNSQNISGGGTRSKDGVDKTDEVSSKEGDAENNTENGDGIYDFKDNKTTGTVTITKKWDDGLTNAEREIPDMYLSTEKPSKSTKGYTITFHGNGLKFADGTDENMVVYSSSGQIVEGSYKEAVGTGVGWYSDKALTQKVEISDDGVPQVELSGDLDLWAKKMTFTLKGYDSGVKNSNGFNAAIPDAVAEIIFTDEVKPKDKEIIDVDADGDGGVVAWLDGDAGTVMKVSTQIPGMKVQAAKGSGYMFYGRNEIQKINFKMLDTQNVTNMSSMFYGCSGLTSLDLTSLNTQKVTKMDFMFADCSDLTSLDLTPLDTQNVTDMSGMFYGCSNLTKLDLSNFDTSNVTTMGGNFEYWLTQNGDFQETYYGDKAHAGMFEYCSSLTALIIPFDTSHVRDFCGMFDGCRKLTVLDVSSFDTSSATNMNCMFASCVNLINIDLSNINTQNVTTMNGMFMNCKNLKKIDLSSFDTRNVTDFRALFAGCSNLADLDLRHLNTSTATAMEGMFYDCSSLTNLNLSNLDTSKVKTMRGLFYNCNKLTNIDISNFSTQNMTDMSDMFSGCSGLTSLDLTPLNTQNVTDMREMFSDCSGLTSLDLSPLDTQKVTNMNAMFSGCSGLTSLDLTPLDTQKVTNMGFMFSGCRGLTSLDLTPLNTQKVTNMTCMFSHCSGLTSLDLTLLDTSKVRYMDSMFYDCSGLTSLTTGTTFKFVGTNYTLPGTWQNTAGETFTSGTFPSNVADTYTKVLN